MEARSEPDGSLVLSYDSRRLSRAMAIAAAVLLAGAGYHLLSEHGDGERLVGFLGGSLTCALTSLVLLEQARVTVDPAARTVSWRRRWAFRTHQGSLSFDDISAVYAERPLGDSGIPSRRVIIATRDGRTIPLTAGYRPDGDRVILSAAEQIRAMLGRHISPVDTVEAMVTAGRLMDAMASLRDSEGLSLSDARKRIDAMRGRQ